MVEENKDNANFNFQVNKTDDPSTIADILKDHERRKSLLNWFWTTTADTKQRRGHLGDLASRLGKVLTSLKISGHDDAFRYDFEKYLMANRPLTDDEYTKLFEACCWCHKGMFDEMKKAKLGCVFNTHMIFFNMDSIAKRELMQNAFKSIGGLEK